MDSPMEGLVEEAKRGSREAFDHLVVACRDPLEKVIRAHLGPELRSEGGGEDILQETLLRAFRSIASVEWQGEKAFFAWLERIAEHAISDKAGERRRPRAAGPPEQARGEPHPAQPALRREETARASEGVARCAAPAVPRSDPALPDRAAEPGEIAERLGRSPEAVRKLLARGLRSSRSASGRRKACTCRNGA